MIGIGEGTVNELDTIYMYFFSCDFISAPMQKMMKKYVYFRSYNIIIRHHHSLNTWKQIPFEIDARMSNNSYLHIQKTKEESINNIKKCSKCFLLNEYCICTKLKTIWSSAQDSNNDLEGDAIPRSHPKLQLYLFTHYKEYGKSSNTGKLLMNIPNLKSEVCIYGNPSDEKMIFEMLNPKKNEITLLLYPGNDSVSIDNARNILNVEHESHSHANSNCYHATCKHSFDNINVIVIDSTWAQSKSMYRWVCRHRKRIDECNKALLNNSDSSDSNTMPPVENGIYINIHSNEAVSKRGSSLFENRKQIAPTKSSTLESTVLSLEYLNLCNQKFLECCYESLVLCVQAMKKQNGKKI